MFWPRRSVVALGTLLICATQPARADTLYLADGRQLVGEVTQKDDNYVIRLKAGALTIPISAVTKWEKDPATPTAPSTTPDGSSPAAGTPSIPAVSPVRTLTPEDQKRALAKMQQSIHQGLMALAGNDVRAALDNFIDARAMAERGRLRLDAADPAVFALFEGLGYCYMQNGRFELATDPMERAYNSPLRGRSALMNRSILSLVQHSSPMRAVKDVQAYLTAHPQKDEPMLNIMGACLYVATGDSAVAKSDLYKLATSFFENKVKELEKTRPGKRRWGLDWVSNVEFANKMEDLEWHKSHYERAARARDTSYAEWQSAVGDWDTKVATIKLTKANSSARSRAVSDADNASRVAADKKSTYERHLADATDQAKKIPWPAWPTRFPPVLPDAAAHPRQAVAVVAVATPQPAPSRDPVNTVTRPPAVPQPVEPSTPSSPPPVAVNTPSTPERRTITRQAVAVPVGPDLLLTSGLLVDAGSTIQLETSNGDQFKAEFVRKDATTGLALLRAPGQRLRYLNVADHFAGGEVQCWGFPEVSIFNVASQGLSGSAAAPKPGWTVSLQKHPRLSGAALVDKAGQLVGIVICERDTVSSQLPAVSAEAVRTFIGADFPASVCGNPDPSGVLQLTASHTVK